MQALINAGSEGLNPLSRLVEPSFGYGFRDRGATQESYADAEMSKSVGLLQACYGAFVGALQVSWVRLPLWDSRDCDCMLVR